MNGRNGPTAFLPLNTKIDGQVNGNKPNIGQFLTREQTRYIYKKTKSGEIINTETDNWTELMIQLEKQIYIGS